MTGVWAVIRREYVERVRSRWFLLTTVGGPLFLLALTLLPLYLGSGGGEAERTLTVVDRTGQLAAGVQRRLEDAGFRVRIEPDTSAATVEALVRQAAQGQVGGVLVVDAETLERGYATFDARSRPSALRRVTLQSAVVQSALEARMGGGSGAEALLQGGDLQVSVLSPGAGSFEEAEFLRIYMGAFLLYMVILFYAVAVMRSTLEEKTSRVVEIVISSMRPWHLMLGKVLGVGAVGLTQLAVWAAVGVVGAVMGLPAMLAARPELTELAEVRRFLPDLAYLGLFVAFFLGGYFIYAAIYAAVGAMVSSEQEAQQAQFPVILLLVAPIVLLPGIIDDPGSTMATVLSLVPFFSPVLMFARSVGGAAPVWQVALSLLLMGLTVLALAWLAGRIYKVGILMAGKRPTLPELLRWIRQP